MLRLVVMTMTIFVGNGMDQHQQRKFPERIRRIAFRYLRTGEAPESTPQPRAAPLSQRRIPARLPRFDNLVESPSQSQPRTGQFPRRLRALVRLSQLLEEVPPFRPVTDDLSIPEETIVPHRRGQLLQRTKKTLRTFRLMLDQTESNQCSTDSARHLRDKVANLMTLEYKLRFVSSPEHCDKYEEELRSLQLQD